MVEREGRRRRLRIAEERHVDLGPAALELGQGHEPEGHRAPRRGGARVEQDARRRAFEAEGAVELVVDAEVEGRRRGAVARRDLGQPSPRRDAVQPVAIAGDRPVALGRCGVEVGLVVLHEVGARPAALQQQHGRHGLPTGGQYDVGTAEGLERRVHRRREGAEELPERLGAPGAPGAILDPNRAAMATRLQRPDEVGDRHVPAAAATEVRDHDGQLERAVSGRPACQRRRAVSLQPRDRERLVERRRGCVPPRAEQAPQAPPHRPSLRRVAPHARRRGRVTQRTARCSMTPSSASSGAMR